jgi:Nucleotidyl transferase AbiEii toxin, Type IV TA system
LRDPKLKNIPASIRQKLLNLARERNEDFGLILTKYGLERILFRLSKSKYREVFILKGALLFELWTEQRYLPTQEADFLAKRDNSPERFVRIFQEISTVEVEDDGLRFDPKTVKAERIKEDADYEGVRVSFTAFLEKGQVPIQIDIGFGDAITPGPVETEYPTLLDLPSPHLLAYPRETVVSEKLEAMVRLGIANSRMKDFHDLHSLSITFEFYGKTLTEARATFKQRGTDLPVGGVPSGSHQNSTRTKTRSSSGMLSATRTNRTFANGVQRRYRSPCIVPGPCHQVSTTGASPGRRLDACSRVASSSTSITSWLRSRSVRSPIHNS